MIALERPPLPEPARQRWQPLRLGLVELYHYDCEEFWFRDGHLLLRGNNGTGVANAQVLMNWTCRRTECAGNQAAC